MPGRPYDIDRQRHRCPHPMWEDSSVDAYVLIDHLTLIDESSNFKQNPFQVRDKLRYQTHYPEEVGFRLLEFFDAPRTREDVEMFYESGLSDRLSDPALLTESLEQCMGRILGLGLLKPAPEHAAADGGWWQGDGRPIRFVAPHMQKHDKRIQSFPATVAINLTEKCNLSCRHCSVGAGPMISSADDLTAEELSRVFDQLEQGGAVTVRLTGGEPTIRRDFWQVFKDAASRRFSLVLFTNGSRITEKDARRLKAVQKAKGSRFSVHLSLDGGTAESHDFLRDQPGNFQRVLRTMKLFQEQGIHFFVESVLHVATFSADEIDRVAAIVCEHGASWLSVHPADQIGNGEGEEAIALSRESRIQLRKEIQPVVDRWKARGLTITFNNYNYPLDGPGCADGTCSEQTSASERKPRQLSWDQQFQRDLNGSRSPGYSVCTAGIAQFALGSNGEVYGCPRYVGDASYSIGSVRERSLLDIWKSSRWDWLREDFGPKLSLCWHCNYKANCFYGRTCRANPGRVFHDRYGVGPECIREYQQLGLPHDVVTVYLKGRIESHPDDARMVALCKTLLGEMEVKQKAACGSPMDATTHVTAEA